MNEKYLRVQKLVGETPLQAIQRFQEANPQYKDIKMSYAGRLDPQASGELIVLLGEETKKQDLYQGLDKIYTFDLLLGIATDTGDVMGLASMDKNDWEEPESIVPVLKDFERAYNQRFPVYSSKPVNGQPLWKWAKDKRLDEVEIPTHEVTIYEVELVEYYRVSARDLLTNVNERINLTDGNFRQTEIIERWVKLLEPLSSDGIAEMKEINKFPVYKIRTKVSSGTYIRQLAIDIGQTLEIPTMCLSIHRESVEI